MLLVVTFLFQKQVTRTNAYTIRSEKKGHPQVGIELETLRSRVLCITATPKSRTLIIIFKKLQFPYK